MRLLHELNIWLSQKFLTIFNNIYHAEPLRPNHSVPVERIEDLQQHRERGHPLALFYKFDRGDADRGEFRKSFLRQLGGLPPFLYPLT